MTTSTTAIIQLPEAVTETLNSVLLDFANRNYSLSRRSRSRLLIKIPYCIKEQVSLLNYPARDWEIKDRDLQGHLILFKPTTQALGDARTPVYIARTGILEDNLVYFYCVVNGEAIEKSLEKYPVNHAKKLTLIGELFGEYFDEEIIADKYGVYLTGQAGVKHYQVPPPPTMNVPPTEDIEWAPENLDSPSRSDVPTWVEGVESVTVTDPEYVLSPALTTLVNQTLTDAFNTLGIQDMLTNVVSALNIHSRQVTEQLAQGIAAGNEQHEQHAQVILGIVPAIEQLRKEMALNTHGQNHIVHQLHQLTGMVNGLMQSLNTLQFSMGAQARSPMQPPQQPYGANPNGGYAPWPRGFQDPQGYSQNPYAGYPYQSPYSGYQPTSDLKGGDKEPTPPGKE